jgi:hypothetical protein
MAETSESIRQDIEATLSTLDAKLDRLEEKVRDSVDVSRQAGAHPWLTIGASVATGYVVGRLIAGDPHPNGEGEPGVARKAGGIFASMIGLAFVELMREMIREQIPALVRAATTANGSRETEPGPGC